MLRKLVSIVSLLVIATGTLAYGQISFTPGSSVSTMTEKDTLKSHFSGLPFVKHGVSQEELAIAVEQSKNGDMSVLNLTAAAYVDAMNQTFPYLRLENRNDLARHIRSLEQVPCPQGKTRLSRLSNGFVDLHGWERDIAVNEQCLWNRKEGRIELSLKCGNPTPELFKKQEVVAAPPHTTIPLLQPPAQKSVEAAPPPAAQRDQTLRVDINIHGDTAKTVVGPNWWARNKEWAKPTGYFAGAVTLFCAWKGCWLWQQKTIVQLTP